MIYVIMLISSFFSIKKDKKTLYFKNDYDVICKASNVVLLQHDSSYVLIVPEWQGRVMTSSCDGMNGFSFGAVNYDFIKKNKIVKKFNNYGGEERFWLGPEGSQYSLFFNKSNPFNLKHWDVPASTDREAFKVISSDSKKIFMQHETEFENMAGTRFSIQITREVNILSNADINQYWQRTYHFIGDKETLNQMAKQLLGIELE